VAFFGDGTCNIGQFYECLNMAALWKLPVIFVVENNLWAIGMSHLRSTSDPAIWKKGPAFRDARGARRRHGRPQGETTPPLCTVCCVTVHCGPCHCALSLLATPVHACALALCSCIPLGAVRSGPLKLFQSSVCAPCLDVQVREVAIEAITRRGGETGPP